MISIAVPAFVAHSLQVFHRREVGEIVLTDETQLAGQRPRQPLTVGVDEGKRLRCTLMHRAE